MEPKKSLATGEATPVDAAFFDMDPQPGRRTTETPAGSPSLRRRSHSSLSPESRPCASMSCVSRDTPEDDCVCQRFIVWAAVKRNRSVRMAASDRLSCPLLRCGERFDDHESMLRHLSKCQHLSTGEYVCYECMKVERFNDKKSKCCSGHPTKRRRIVNLAKNFFSNIGNKSRQGGPLSPPRGEPVISPPSYDSLVVDTHRLYEEQEQERRHQQQCEQERDDDVEMHEPRQPQIELNGTELLELDSTPLSPMAQLDSINYDSQSTNAPSSSDAFHRQPSSTLAPSVNIVPQSRSSSPYHHVRSLPSSASSASGGRRPSLALDTHLDRYRSAPRQTFLSPSSSLRSTMSSQGVSPITPWSASSKSSSAWTTGSNIDTAMTSPITPFGANSYPAASTAEYRLFGEKKDTQCPPDPCSYALGNMPELPGDNPLSIAFPHGLSDPLLFSFDPKDNYSWMSSVDTEISLGTSVNMMFTDPNSRPANIPSEFLEPPGSRLDTRALVESVWDAIREHISSSRSNLAHIQGNPLATRLQVEPERTIALTGLSSFKKILNGNDVTDPFDYLCFVHVVYAFSIIMHEDDLIARSNKFYNQALAYKGFLDPVYLDIYTQVVAAIWQPPPEHHPKAQSTASLNRSSSSKGKGSEYHIDSITSMVSDPLVVAGQNFLDHIENSAINTDSDGPIGEVLTSDLLSTHLADGQPGPSQNNAFAVTANYIIQDLSRAFQDSGDLLSGLRAINQRIQAGEIGAVRKLELALIETGKGPLMSSDLFEKFIPQVKTLCDSLYSQQGFHPRARYQILGVSLIETLIRSIAQEQQSLGGENFPIMPDPFDEFWQGLDPTGILTMDSGPSIQQQQQQQQPIHAMSDASSFDPVVRPTTLHQTTPNIQIPNSLYSKRFTPTATPPVTPGESFVVPTVSSPDLPREIATATSSPPGLSATPIHAPMSEGFGASVSEDKLKASPFGASVGQKVEANDCCEICGYRPKGDPQWFKGSMAKHKKLQHSTGPPTIYKCPYPGCSSQYKNRQDNLRQHQIEKNHFVDDEATGRPSKRKKTSQN